MEIDVPALICLVCILVTYGGILLPWQEKRTDLVRINDRLLTVFSVEDMSVPIAFLHWFSFFWFFMMWGMWDINQTIFMFITAITVRSIILFLHPFEAPLDCIPLRDPIVEYFVGNQDAPLVRDLSVSGHVLVTASFGILLGNTWTNIYYAISIIEGIMLMIMRAHYTADIFLSLFVAPSCYQLSRLFAYAWDAYSLWPFAYVFAAVLIARRIISE